MEPKRKDNARNIRGGKQGDWERWRLENDLAGQNQEETQMDKREEKQKMWWDRR